MFVYNILVMETFNTNNKNNKVAQIKDIKSYSTTKEKVLNNKKQILVITLPSYFLNVIKVLKTNKEQYFILYRDKYNIRGKRFDAIVVDSSMPFHLEFYNDIMKYIRYDVPSYLLENETLKILK